MSRVSVIIPTYQHAITIKRCLDAVLRQTLAPSEVIVIDDGSTDETRRVVEPFISQGTVRYLFQENRGSNPARNRGFRESSGEYVIFLDADVVMRKDMLAKLVQALHDHPQAGFAYSGFRFGWKRFSGFPFNADRLRRMNFIHTSALIRSDGFPGFDEAIKRFQDWDVWLTLLKEGKEGVFVDEELFRVLLPHGRAGISSWRPSFLYGISWSILGWRPPSVRRYEEARDVIRKKHHL